jgi:hypothetical protein
VIEVKFLAIPILLLTCSALALGDTAVIKADNDETDRGMVVIDIDSDGTDLYVGSSLNDTNTNSWALVTNYDVRVALIGFQGMFEAIPQIISRDSIISATLKVYQRGPEGGEQIEVDRVTTPWLLLGAGHNETVVTGVHRSTDLFWAGGESVGFSSLDYTVEDAATYTYIGDNYNGSTLVDVTEMVKDMYDEGNQGFVLRQIAGAPDPWLQGDEKDETGDDGYETRPALYIEYSIGLPHTLTVNSGSGDGDYYVGTSVDIAANAPASGQGFVAWTGDVAGIANVYNSSTTMVMPGNAATITATYAPSHQLTVVSGSGDGTYGAGHVVEINADAPPHGQEFDLWIGDTGGIADVASADTTIAMPATNATVTATYTDVPGHYLTVMSGLGSGTYAPGNIVTITASPAPTGQEFRRWVGDVSTVANIYAASTTLVMPDADTKVGAYCKDTGSDDYTAFQNLDAATDRIYRIEDEPYLDLIDANGFYQTETIIFHDIETGAEEWSLTRELCTDLANIERRTAWSCNGQYISFIGNKAFWNYTNNSLWNGTWPGYNYIANADSSKRRRLWAKLNGTTTMSFTDKFNNWDMSTPNYLYYPSGNKLVRVTLGPGNNVLDNTAEYVYTFPNSNSRIIQEMHDWNYMLVEESGSSPNCYVFDLNVPNGDPPICYSYPLAGTVHPGSFRFRRSDVIVTGGYEPGGGGSGGICLKLDRVNNELIPWTLPNENTHDEEMWHLWYGTPDDRVCWSGTALGQSFGLWVRLPGQIPIKMGDVCDGHSTWCGHDPDWAFYSSGTNEGEQPHVDPALDRHVMAVKADGSQLIVILSPWDRRRGGYQGYDAISRPNQSPDATKFWFHSSMLNPADDYTGSYIGVFRKPHPPTEVTYSGGLVNFAPHTLSYEAKCFRVYRNSGSGWQFVQEVPKGETSFAASEPGTYMLTSLEWSGLESDVSSSTVQVPGGATGEPVSDWDTTPPDRPSNLQVAKVSAGRYRLTWDAPADQDLRYFNVYFSTFENPAAVQERLIVSPPKGERTYLDWTAPVGGAVFYGITAVDYQGNESAPRYIAQPHHLAVNSGSGDGDYDEGEVVAIVADAAPSGQQFAGWTGDTGALADPAAASTTVTMPDTDMEVTATYSQVPPSLAGDRSGDGFVGQADLDIILGSWGQHVAALSAPDPSGDGFVGQADLDIVLGQWGQGTHP